MIKKVFLLLLVYSFNFSIVFASAESYQPMIYDNDWKSLTRQEINKRMNEPIININTKKPFNFKIVDEKDQEVDIQVNTAVEFLNLAGTSNRIYIYTTYDIIDMGLFEGVALPLIYYSQAKPSKYSFVRDFSFIDGDPIAMLPVDFVSWAGSDQREFIESALKQKRSWRDVSPNARIIKVSDISISIYDTFAEDFYNNIDDEKYTGEFASHVLSTEVMGDLNNDGYEDMVVSYAHYYVEGSGRSYHHKVLTRKSADAVLEDITEEVNKKIWKGK